MILTLTRDEKNIHIFNSKIDSQHKTFILCIYRKCKLLRPVQF